MSRVRLYSGKFNPETDMVVKDGLALSIQQFGRLTLDAQQSVVDAGAKYGDKGVPDPEWNVPPMCRRGVSLAELKTIYDRSDERIRQGLDRKMSNDKFEKKIQQLRESAEEIREQDHGK